MAITLTTASRLLRDRIAEEGVEFWDDDDVTQYLNLAQDYIASITRGVSESLTETVDKDTPFIQLPARTLNAHQLSGVEHRRGGALGTVSVADANLISPGWRTVPGYVPKWVVLDVDAKLAYVSPVPQRPVDISLRVSVLPEPATVSSPSFFNGNETMDKYRNVLINMAAVYAYQKDRLDPEAERAYGFVMAELRELGVNPNSIPAFVEVDSGNNSG